jgi:hypothetical protein
MRRLDDDIMAECALARSLNLVRREGLPDVVRAVRGTGKLHLWRSFSSSAQAPRNLYSSRSSG